MIAGRGKPLEVASSQLEHETVKSECSWSVFQSGAGGIVIELSSDSESDSSESVSLANTTDDDGEAKEARGDGTPSLPVLAQPVPNTVVARNEKTKIVHECHDKVAGQLTNQDAFMQTMKDTLTTCGCVITSSYKVINGDFDWTAKCRVCFKGRRAPGA